MYDICDTEKKWISGRASEQDSYTVTLPGTISSTNYFKLRDYPLKCLPLRAE